MVERSKRSNTSISPQHTPKDSDTKGNIKVFCRFRPISNHDESSNPILSLNFLSNSSVSFKNPYDDNLPLVFSFDKIFPPEATQQEVYEQAAQPIIDSVFKGFNGTLMAYGQTASGKTFTMMGSDITGSENKGIIPRMACKVFDYIEKSNENFEFSVKVAFCEIYLEKIRDLIRPLGNLKMIEDRSRGVYIQGLTEEYVGSDEEMLGLLRIGCKNREVACTLMNEQSSRSHSIFLVTITETDTRDLSSKSGKLYLVDLAGSEKLSKSGAQGKRLDEAKHINKSLSALGLVITCLTDGKSAHIPYRDSKLTRLLQDSLGGNSLTSLIITCSPSNFNAPETLSTLRFGLRAKTIKNKPRVNKQISILELKSMLNKANQNILNQEAKIAELESILLNSSINPNFPLNKIKNSPQVPLQALLADAKAKLNTEIQNSVNLQQALQEQFDRNLKLVRENKNLSAKVISLIMTMQEIEGQLNESQEQNKKNELVIQAKTRQISDLEEIMKTQEIKVIEQEKEMKRTPKEYSKSNRNTEDSVITECTQLLDESNEDQKAFDSLGLINSSFDSCGPSNKSKHWETHKQDLMNKEILIANLKYEKIQSRFYKNELENLQQESDKRLRLRVTSLEEKVSSLNLSYKEIENKVKGKTEKVNRFKAVSERMKNLESLMSRNSEECQKLKVIEEERSGVQGVRSRIRRGRAGLSGDSRLSATLGYN